MRILITGSRHWTDRATIETAIRYVAAGLVPESVTVVHGADKGADKRAGAVAEQMGISVEEYPADWKMFGNAAGPLRNQEMVDRGADVCLAFPMPGSVGTWDCVRRAAAAGIPVSVDYSFVLAPDDAWRWVRNTVTGNLDQIPWTANPTNHT